MCCDRARRTSRTYVEAEPCKWNPTRERSARESDDPLCLPGPSDVLPDGVPGNFKYIFQGYHKTAGGYVDTLNFWIKPIDGFRCTLGATSISNIHGALGDSGQNYKTLTYLLKHFPTTSGYEAPKVVHGCTMPAAR